jgi:hypothetical protein
MLGWVLVVALNAALTAIVVRAAGRPAPSRALRRAMLGSVVLLVLGVAAGVIWGLGRSFAAVSDASVEPSQKARILAEGISETMNCAAFGFVVLFLPTLLAIVLYLRSRKEAPPHDAAPR